MLSVTRNYDYIVVNCLDWWDYVVVVYAADVQKLSDDIELCG